MKRSTERILTTHTGSIARPDDLIDLMREKENGRPYDQEAFAKRVRSAVAECVDRQIAVGLDVINDGEQGKSGFTSYQAERLSGFEAVPIDESNAPASTWKEVAEFPEYYDRYFKTNMRGATLGPRQRMVCRGDVRYIGHDAVQTDIENLRSALVGKTYEEAFLSAALPTGLANQTNEYYATRDEFLSALADAVHEEYRAIIDAGFLIQLDDPAAAELWGHRDLNADERARRIDETVELINYSLRGIPPEKIRYHTCYSINMGPHIYDLHLRDFIEPMLGVNAQAVSFEVMNLRHIHDYHAFEDVKLPDGKIIIPGMSSNGANWVEHPELIAELTVHYANLVGRENVLIGNDCGFASQAGAERLTRKSGGRNSALSPREPASPQAVSSESSSVKDAFIGRMRAYLGRRRRGWTDSADLATSDLPLRISIGPSVSIRRCSVPEFNGRPNDRSSSTWAKLVWQSRKVSRTRTTTSTLHFAPNHTSPITSLPTLRAAECWLTDRTGTAPNPSTSHGFSRTPTAIGSRSSVTTKVLSRLWRSSSGTSTSESLNLVSIGVGTRSRRSESTSLSAPSYFDLKKSAGNARDLSR